MALPESEQKYYDKWLEIFEKEISDRYKDKFPERFTDLKITKLAQENARYLTFHTNINDIHNFISSIEYSLRNDKKRNKII